MVDTHCHLNFPELQQDLEGVLARAAEAGVDRYVVPGTELESSTSSLELSQKYAQIYAGIGVHPTDAHEYDAEKLQKVKELTGASGKLVSIGEVGLDYYHFEGLNKAEIAERKQAQAYVFSEMISLAKERDLPLIIHSRDAFAETFHMLQEEAAGHPTVIHCFSGTQEEASQWLDAGCLISFTGMVTYKKNDALREVVKRVPLEKMMLETDAPFLAPEGFRGQMGEPRFVRNVAECVAEVKGLTLEEVDRVTTENAERFFHLNHA